MAICYDSIITYLWYLWLQSTKYMKMCIVLCLLVNRVCYLPIIAEYYLQMLFFLLFSDLYANQIKLYSHNYTTLPKALTRMWVFYSLHNCLYCLIVATILDKNVKKNACSMSNFRTLPSKARFTQDTSPSPQKKQSWSVAGTFLLPAKQHWPVRGGGRGHHGAKFAGWVSCE